MDLLKSLDFDGDLPMLLAFAASAGMVLASVVTLIVIYFVRRRRGAAFRFQRKAYHCSPDVCGHHLHHLHERANLVLAMRVSADYKASLRGNFPNASIREDPTDILKGTVDLIIASSPTPNELSHLGSLVRPWGYMALPPDAGALSSEFVKIGSLRTRSLNLFRRTSIQTQHKRRKIQKGRIVAVNYATDSHLNLQLPCTESLLKDLGVDAVVSYGQEDVDVLYRSFASIMKAPRGAGYWLWKPYVVLHTMMACDAEYVLYCDSSTKMLWDRHQLIDALGGKQILAFITMWIEREWTKRDAFLTVLGPGDHIEEADATKSNQIAATVTLYRNSPRSLEFLREWASLCLDENLISDQPNGSGLGNFRGFQEHRHDQSLLSLLCKTKYKSDVTDVSAWQVYHQHYFG